MISKKYFFLLLFYFSLNFIFSQEIKCTVAIDTRQLQTTQSVDKQIYNDLQKAISDFINNRKWTNDKFSAEERINCFITIYITKVPAIGFFEANAQIQVTRPIYGSSYDSNVLTFVDRDWQFQYNTSQPLDVFNENTYSNNLSSILAFYANVILGIDYDSFSKLGGTDYIQKAFTIANNASQGVENGEKGWKAFEDRRNRYWLIENLQNQQLLPLRENSYTYHRLAMDNFSQKPDDARTKIMDVLNKMKQVNQIRPSAVLSNIFFDAKASELVSIFKLGDPSQRQQAFNIMSELDPTNTDRYRQLISGK